LGKILLSRVLVGTAISKVRYLGRQHLLPSNALIQGESISRDSVAGRRKLTIIRKNTFFKPPVIMSRGVDIER
jgi:hypothetical protein